MLKKVSKLLVMFLLVAGSLFSFLGGNAVHASIKNFDVHNPEVKHFTEKMYLKIDDEGKAEKVSKTEIKNEKELAREVYENSKQEKLYNTKKIDPKTIESSEEESINPTSKASYVEVTHDIIFNSTNRTIKLKATITKLIGTKPIIILTGYNLHSSKNLEGSYSKVTGFDVEWTGPEIYVGKSHSKTYSVTSTNFWMTSGTTTAGWIGSYPITESGQGGPVLTNKKASFYPVIENKHSGQYMPIPVKANMSVVPKGNRVPWNNTLRGKYIASYINTYGNPNWDWSLLDIHHVIPREYGGGNSFYNLFPLPRDLHQKVVTPWWSNY